MATATKSFNVRFNATEKSHDLCAEFQALAIGCQCGLCTIAKTELQRGSGSQVDFREEQSYV